jgi:hypothetical protein
MAGPINRTATAAPPSRTGDANTTMTPTRFPSLKDDYKISDHIRGDGSLNLDDATYPPEYKIWNKSFGEQGQKSVEGRVEKSMGEWVKNNPNATKEQFTDQLKKTLQVQGLVQQEMRNSLQKFMSQMFDKMKEMASDRFSDDI